MNRWGSSICARDRVKAKASASVRAELKRSGVTATHILNQVILTVMTDWIAWDVIETALAKTRCMLFEPFDLKKWVKLAVILLFIGGCGGYGGNGGGGGPGYRYNLQDNGFGDFGDHSEFNTAIEEAIAKISTFVDQNVIAIILAVISILLTILLLSYISSIMEFALVESVVTNRVMLRAYIRNNMGNALQLFALRWTLTIIFLIAIILSLLPAIPTILDGNFGIAILGSIFLLFVVIIISSIIFAVIGSFINMAIPVMLYEDVGVIGALLRVIGTAKHSVSQLLVYWVLRIILSIVVSIVAAIAGIIVFLLAMLILVPIGVVIYYLILAMPAVTGFLDPVFLIGIGLYIFVAILIILFSVTLATVPLPVFMKYHTLLFLRDWYADIVPFHEDVPLPAPLSQQA